MRKILIGTAVAAIAAMTTAYAVPVDAQGRSEGNGKARPEQAANPQGAGNRAARQAERQAEPQAERRADVADRSPPSQARDPREPRGSGRGAQRDSDDYRGATRYRENGGLFFAKQNRAGNPRLIEGCPPGLAKKRNGCQPPGQQAKKRIDPGLFGLSGNGLSYRDGYIVRYDEDGISSYVPLLGGALSIGEPWPGEFGVARVPDYLRAYFNLGDSYRYYDDTLYRLDPDSGAITSVAGLVTGDDIAVGEPMPPGYDVYNVPVGYRDRYRDRPDADFRYSDGYIYEVDPQTRLVEAAIRLLT